MSENLTQRWAIAGQVLPFRLANALAEINGWTEDSNEYQSCVRGWNDDLFRVAKSGELTFKSAQGVPLPPCADAFNLGFVDLHDFCEWADRVGSTGIPKDPHALAKALGFDVEPQAAPVVAASASGGVGPDETGPLPLTTGDIAFCFAGLRWEEQKWKKPLGDKPKWLAVCIAIPGVRGVSETRWNPVLIGAALERGGHAKQNSIRARFQTKPRLAEWLDAWKTYEADNYGSN